MCGRGLPLPLLLSPLLLLPVGLLLLLLSPLRVLRVLRVLRLLLLVRALLEVGTGEEDG